jgi:hypothetical protein
MTGTPLQIFRYHIKNDEPDRTCGERNACGVLEDKPERKRPLGRPWLRWENNAKVHHKNGMGGCGLDYLVWDRDKTRASVNMVMNRQDMSCPAGELLISQEQLRVMEFVGSFVN